MKLTRTRPSIALLALTGVLSLSAEGAALAQDNPCRTGGRALSRAYSYSLPIVILVDDRLINYIGRNSAKFGRTGDATRCAQRVVQALRVGARVSFDPDYLRNMEQINRDIVTEGGPSRPAPMSQSAFFRQLANELDWFADAAVDASRGDWDEFANGGTGARRQGLGAMRAFGQMISMLPGGFNTIRPLADREAALNYDVLSLITRQVATQ